MKKKMTNEQELLAAVADADPMNKAWINEVVRIRQKRQQTELETWEEVLIDLTLELEPTMKKIFEKRKRDKYDQFLLELLLLLVLPEPDDPHRRQALHILGVGTLPRCNFRKRIKGHKT